MRAAMTAEEGGIQLTNMAWIRTACDAESLAGRGVKCWVKPQVLLQPGGERSPGKQEGRGEVRVLVGNRALIAEEEVPISRWVMHWTVESPCSGGWCPQRVDEPAWSTI